MDFIPLFIVLFNDFIIALFFVVKRCGPQGTIFIPFDLEKKRSCYNYLDQ